MAFNQSKPIDLVFQGGYDYSMGALSEFASNFTLKALTPVIPLLLVVAIVLFLGYMALQKDLGGKK